jgi:hypothetical protein
MMLESHLPLHAQKAVVGKLLGLQVIVPWLSSLEQDTAERLDRCLCWQANLALTEPDDRSALEAFLMDLVHKINAEVGRLPLATQSDVAHIVREMTEVVTNFCMTPFDPLERLVNAVAQTSSDFYQTYGIKVPPELWRRTLPIFSFFGGKKGLSFCPDIHLKIFTEFHEGDTLPARVFLKVAPRWLDARTIAALPRVILHEYIAHVPQGPYMGRRINPDPTDAFAEGWMDYLAHQVHQAVLERRGPFHALAGQLLPAWKIFYEASAERFFAERWALRDGDPAAAARCEGVMAGSLLHDLLRGLPETAHDPDAYLFRLSFGLNSSSLDDTARQRFVALVRRSLALASEVDTLVAPLRKWASGAISLEQLSEMLLAIRSSRDV